MHKTHVAFIERRVNQANASDFQKPWPFRRYLLNLPGAEGNSWSTWHSNRRTGRVPAAVGRKAEDPLPGTWRLIPAQGAFGEMDPGVGCFRRKPLSRARIDPLR